VIGFSNQFRCGDWVLDKGFVNSNYGRYFKLGNHSHIGKEHYFDATGGMEIKNNSWIGGNGSQFWTHGIGVTEREIIIGEGCYISSGVRFSPGVKIANNCLVSLGSLVTKSFTVENLLIGTAPARVIQADYNWQRYKEGAAEPVKPIE